MTQNTESREYAAAKTSAEREYAAAAAERAQRLHDEFDAYSRDEIVNALRETQLTDATSKTSKRDALAMIVAEHYVAENVRALLTSETDADETSETDADETSETDADALTLTDVLAFTDTLATLARVEDSRVDVTVKTDIDADEQRVVFTRANRDALASAHVAVDASDADALRATTRIAFADCVARMTDADVSALDALVSHTDTRRSRVIVNADADTLRSIASVLRDAARNVFDAQNAQTDALAIEDSQQIALRASHCATLARMLTDADVHEYVSNASSKRERSMRSIADALA